MASIQAICQNCGAAVDMQVGQVLFGGQLEWHETYTCARCGTAIMVDGIGIAPEEVRQAILREEGTWELVVPETGRRALLVLKALRTVFSLSVADAGRLREHLPGAVSSGTHTEMLWLQGLLQDEGLTADVRRADPDVQGRRMLLELSEDSSQK